MGRFISADAFTTTDVGGVLSANMFAYCENNPVMGYDPMGEFWGELIISAVVGGILGASSAAMSGGNVIKGAICGVISGGLTGAAGTAKRISGVISGAATGAFTSAATYHRTSASPSIGGAIASAVFGAVSGAIGGLLSVDTFGVVGTSIATYTSGLASIFAVCRSFGEGRCVASPLTLSFSSVGFMQRPIIL